MREKAKPLSDGATWRVDTSICGTLCICQALAVLSAVSIIYLSVIVYLPAKRELESGIGETPVMCTTVERRKTEHHVEACDESSCTEWCLGKGSGPCDQIHVNVRQNGTDVDFEGCHDVFHKECPVLDADTASVHNCKKDNQCTVLEGVFICRAGICTNISQVFACTWEKDQEETPLNCYYKRNCVKLDGEYVCRAGQCSRVGVWKCQRKCERIPFSGQNLLVIAGNHLLTAHCRAAIDSRTGIEIWKDSIAMTGKVVTTSCTHLQKYSDLIRLSDCINGSVIPSAPFGSFSNLTSIMDIYQEVGLKYRFDNNSEILDKPRKTHLPFDFEVEIYKKSLLFINHEGCVNTLQHECTAFYKNLGQDGRNQTSPSRFPCYYAPHNDKSVVQRYDLIRTKWWFLLFFSVPSSILLISCSMLFICSRVVGVTKYGAMAMMLSCCKPKPSPDIAMKEFNNESDDELL